MIEAISPILPNICACPLYFPYGNPTWIEQTAEQLGLQSTLRFSLFGLQSTLRRRGRPDKECR